MEAAGYLYVFPCRANLIILLTYPSGTYHARNTPSPWLRERTGKGEIFIKEPLYFFFFFFNLQAMTKGLREKVNPHKPHSTNESEGVFLDEYALNPILTKKYAYPGAEQAAWIINWYQENEACWIKLKQYCSVAQLGSPGTREDFPEWSDNNGGLLCNWNQTVEWTRDKQWVVPFWNTA